MSKQDRQGVRTPAGLERKYPFGQIRENQNKSNSQNIQLNQLQQEFAQYKASVAGDIKKLNQFIDDIGDKFEELEENDKMWLYSGAPTLENYPAVDWTTDEFRAKHMGDMYYDVDNGNMYIFKYVDEVYSWDSCLGGGCDVDHDALRQVGYNEGYTKGKNDGETIGYNKGYTEGQESVPNMLGYPSVVRFPSCNVFGKKEVELNLGEYITELQSFITVNSNSTADNVNNILEHLTINCLGLPTTMSSFMNCAYAFRDEVLKKITLNFDTKNVTNFSNAFNCLVALEEIDGTPLDLSSAVNVTNIFNYCNALKEARFKANTIKISMSLLSVKMLSITSIQSIFDGLATVSTAQTLTLNANQNVLQSQIDSANSKGWTVVGGKVVQEAW